MSREVDRHYHNLRYPEAFTARSNLKKFGNIDAWAKKEDVLTEYSQFRSFPRRPTVAHSRNAIWSIDLAEFRNISQFNKGYNYLAIACDVLTRFTYAIPLKSKRPSEVAEQFSRLFKKVRPSVSVFVDGGSEFLSDFKTLMQKYNIQTWVARTVETKSAIAERTILKFKQRLYRYFHYKKTKTWIDIYQLIVDGINNSYHRIIKMKPSECVSIEMQRKAFINTYKHRLGFIPKPGLSEGDRVRISKLRHPLKKRYLQSFTTEKFVVKKVLPKENQNIYTLEDENKETIIGSFSKPELRLTE
jgi:hypothetical protein